MLNVAGISKSFAAPVLQDVTFTLEPGTVLAILGASGGGKTTLLRMIAGLEKPSSGTITSTVTRPGPGIGYMGQSAPLAPWLTALDNAILPARLAGVSSPAHKLRAASELTALGLMDDLQKHPRELSGGMQQRVAIAGMLTLEPQLYLMDEPLGQLDIPLRRRVADVLRDDVKRRKAAAIIVTHSIEEALFIADRIIVLARPQPHLPSTVLRQFSVGAALPGHEKLDEATAYHTILEALEHKVAA